MQYAVQATPDESGRPPRGTSMWHLNPEDRLVIQRGTKKEGKRSSMGRLAVYKNPLWLHYGVGETRLESGIPAGRLLQ